MLFLKDVESVAETKIISSIDSWFVSYQSSDPMCGLYQDSIIGAFEMTKDSVDKIEKFHAMRMCNRATMPEAPVFNQPYYHSRELLSLYCPEINYEGKAKFYVPEFASYIKYSDTEINVSIKRGKIVSGVLDKGTVGQGTHGSILHVIYAEKGATTAFETIYNWQQLTNGFIYYHGITFGLADVYLNPKAREKLRMETAKIVAASEEVTEQLNAGKLLPPMEMTLREYYEELQSAALEHGDEFIKSIMEEMDPNDNWLYKFVFSGSKGDRSNMTAIYASIGSIGLKGGRIPITLNGRTSINFPRYSTEPISRGYCPASFSMGIPAIIFPFAAMEARYELIEVALSTALAGTMNRNAVKNLESIVVSNSRGSIKRKRVVQFLFGETGIDPRKVEFVSFPSIKPGLKEFRERFHTDAKSLDKTWRHKEAQSCLDKEFASLTQDRDEFRGIMLRLERDMRKNFILKDKLRMPVNVPREIQNVRELARSVTDASGKPRTPKPLNPLKAVALVDEYCSSIGYCYMNNIARKAKREIPHHIESAVTFLKILIRSWLCTSNLLRNDIDNELLEQILDRLSAKIGECFIEYGTSVGIIAAESISEPITQFLLDAKHRSGLKKEKTSMIDRFDEILKNKKTEAMDNPQQILIPAKEYLQDKQRVVEIANHIEMLPMGRFVTATRIFMETFGVPEHPDYIHEKTMIQKFLAFTQGETVPKDLVPWCIRFDIDREEMVLKSMKIKTIYLELTRRFPQCYVVYLNQPGASTLVMRVYIRNTMFKRGSDISEANIRILAHDIKMCVIRGTDGITSCAVKDIVYSTVDDDGAMVSKKMWVIETDGTNLSKTLENQYLNGYECNTTSIDEIERMYGIEAARNKIVDELLTTEKHKANYEWGTIYADEMAYNGRVTSIQRSGLGVRESNNVLLRCSFGSPVQVIQQAAINNQTDHIGGMSAPLCMGTVPNFGTTWNQICIDQQSVRELAVSDAQLIEAI